MSTDIENMIIDMRNNGGGNSKLFYQFRQNIIAHSKINQPNHLFVITDRNTFSSGTMNAVELLNEASAILVGEQTGDKVNGYGDICCFTLPNSNFDISYSIQYFDFIEGTDTLEIDIPINITIDDYKNGVDRAVDTIFQLITQN